MIALHVPAESVNPYNRLLREALSAAGVGCELWTDPPRRGNPRELLPRLRRADLVHWHWLQSLYQGSTRIRFLFRLVLFASLMLELRVRRIPQVVTVHNLVPHEREFDTLHRLACRVIGGLADRLLVHSPQAVDLVARLYGGGDKIRILPHIDYEDPVVTASQSELRSRWGLTEKPHWAIAFGGIRPYKGIHLAVRAARALGREGFGLIVAGPCPDRTYANDLLETAGESRVLFVLRQLEQRELSELLLASDVALMPHQLSLTSGTAQLALAHGLPIVATESPAFRELADRGLAMLCDFADPDALVGSIVRASGIRSPQWKASVEDYRRERSPAVIGPRLAEIYAELSPHHHERRS